MPATPEQTEAQPSSVKAAKANSSSMERPEELVPALISFLKAHAELKGVGKAVQVGFHQPNVQATMWEKTIEVTILNCVHRQIQS